MSRFASMTKFNFEPIAEDIALDAAAVAYSTPQILREQLLDLGFVQGLRAKARFYMTHNSTSGTATVKLTNGINDLLSVDISLSASPVSFSQDVDLSLVSQTSFLYWEVEVTTGGTASSVGRMVADLTVQSPLFVTAGQC